MWKRRYGKHRERPSSCADGMKDELKPSVIIVGLWKETPTAGLPDILQLYYGVHLRVLCAQLYCAVALVFENGEFQEANKS